MIVDISAVPVITQNGSRRLQNETACPSCGYQNPAGVNSCLNCMASLAARCPVCGQTGPAGGKFCGQCGSALASQPARTPAEVQQKARALLQNGLARKLSPPAAEIFGEYREVTVMFVSFVSATVAVDEEELYFAKDEALKLLCRVVEKYEGAVDKFTQAGLVALFGAPISHENDPERAVRAALEMQRVLQPWFARVQAETGLAFGLACSLNSGSVVAGTIGSDQHMDYTVIGPTVKVAAHLETLAKPGTIIIGEETYRRLHLIFDCEALPTVTVDGFSIRPYRLFDRLAPAAQERAASRFQLAMIGRAPELVQLQRALTEVRHNKCSRMVLLTGETGVGKTRLVTEFRQFVNPEEMQIFEGSSMTYTRAMPLGVVAALLRNILKISGTTPVRVQHEKLLAYLQQLNLASLDIVPYLTLVLGLRQTDPAVESRLRLLDAAMLQRQTHAALRQLLLAEARRRPTILIFEDLHWIDPASREFLEYLIQTSSDAPLLLILVSRTAERITTINSFVTLAAQSSERWLDLELEPLSAVDTQKLVDQLIAQSSVEAELLKQQIARRAEGNPLFAEEIVRMLVDQGGLRRDSVSGAWQISPEANGLLTTVPGTIKGLILARFDRLPEGLRRTLQKAAVFGSSFPIALLQAVNDPTPEATAVQLDALAVRQFLTSQPYRSSPGYAFQHTLLQETIYHALIKRDRSKIHTQIAQAIECSPLWLPEEHAEVLAHHYGESTFPLKAVPYLMAAGNNAARRCAYETAIKHFRRAIRILPPRPENDQEAFFQARLGLGNALKFVGELTSAGEVLTDALHKLWLSNLALQPDSLQAILIESLRQLADVRQREGSYNAALRYLDVGLHLLSSPTNQPDSTAHRSLLDRIAWIHFRQGQLDKALSVARSATESLAADTANDPITLASLYNTLGGIAWQQDRLEQAIAHVQRSLELYDQIGYMWGVAIAYGNLGILFYQQGQWPKALHYYEQAYAVHQVIGNPEGQAVSFDNLGLLYLAMGDYARAQKEFEAALTIRQQLGDSWGTAQTEINLAQLALAQAQFSEASRHAGLALSLAGAIGSSEIQVEGHWVKALAYAETERLPEALQAGHHALAMAQKAGLNQKEPDCLRVLGSLQRRNGQYEAAEPLLQEALKLSQDRNDPYQQGQAWLELGRLYQAQARCQASSAFESAADLFERLGAHQLLHQARAATVLYQG